MWPEALPSPSSGPWQMPFRSPSCAGGFKMTVCAPSPYRRPSGWAPPGAAPSSGGGRFRPGYEFDAVVLDDSRLTAPRPLTVAQRLERAVYLSEDRDVVRKFVQGREVRLPS